MAPTRERAHVLSSPRWDTDCAGPTQFVLHVIPPFRNSRIRTRTHRGQDRRYAPPHPLPPLPSPGRGPALGLAGADRQ
eukprot:2790352-Pyramimonas_sp.AAC.1